jgi:hypothetical protein
MVGARAGAGDRPLPRPRQAALFSRRRGLANPEIYEFIEAEGIVYTIRLPANSVVQDRIGYLLEAPGRATAARGALLLRQLQLSGAELEEAETCRGQGRVASG